MVSDPDADSPSPADNAAGKSDCASKPASNSGRKTNPERLQSLKGQGGYRKQLRIGRITRQWSTKLGTHVGSWHANIWINDERATFYLGSDSSKATEFADQARAWGEAGFSVGEVRAKLKALIPKGPLKAPKPQKLTLRRDRSRGSLLPNWCIIAELGGLPRHFSLGTEDKNEAETRRDKVRQWLFVDGFGYKEVRRRLKSLKLGPLSIDAQTIRHFAEGRPLGSETLGMRFAKLRAVTWLKKPNNVCNSVLSLVIDAFCSHQQPGRHITPWERSDPELRAMLEQLPMEILGATLHDAAQGFNVTAPLRSAERQRQLERFRRRVRAAQRLVGRTACSCCTDPEIEFSNGSGFSMCDSREGKIGPFPRPPAEVIRGIHARLASDWASPKDRNLSLAVSLALSGLKEKEIAAAQWDWLQLDDNGNPGIAMGRGPDFVPGRIRGRPLPISRARFDDLLLHQSGTYILQGSKDERCNSVFCRVNRWLKVCGLSGHRSPVRALRELYGLYLAGEENLHEYELSIRLGIWRPERVRERLLPAQLGPELRSLWHHPLASPISNIKT